MHKCYTIQDWVKAWTQGGSEYGSGVTEGGTDEPPVVKSAAVRGTRASSVVGAGVPDEVVSCPRCMAACDQLDDLLESLEHFDPAVAEEHFETEAAYQALVALPIEHQEARISTEASVKAWALCQRFLGETEVLWKSSPRLALIRARTGVLLAEALNEDFYHPRWVADLRAKAHAFKANSLRILARFIEAEREFAIAQELLARGVNSGQREARVLALKASLRISQRRLGDAESLLERVETFYERTGQRAELARIQLKQATAFNTRGEYRLAADACARACENLGPSDSSHLAALACQNAVFYLLCAGEIEQARNLFSSLPSTDERMTLVRRRWIEADLLRAEGNLQLAMEAYDDARRRYAEQHLPYDVALVALDEAAAALEFGDHERMQELAREASLLLSGANAPTEAVALLTGLASSLEQGTVSRSVLTAIRKRLADARPKR